jgi:ankyrin repeat protein
MASEATFMTPGHSGLRTMLCAVSLAAVSLPAAAQDSVIGTFTVNGKTTKFTNVYATLEASPTNGSEKYLILLVSDVPIAPADRVPAKLTSLASSGTIHALKLRWKYGFDSIAVVPYHAGVQETGFAMASMSTVNLSALSDDRVHAEFKSKMLGQTWFFNALIKAAIVKGGTAMLEPDVDATVTPAGGGGKTDPTSLKRALGGMGYEYTPDAFFQAIGDHKAEAVKLFIQAGMSPNQKNDQNRYALNHAVLFCSYAPAEAAEVILALLAGKADVKAKDPDNGTTALVGSVQSCNVAVVEALIKAGSDLNAKSNGGATALQLANIYQRPDIAAALKKAGAK